jgi:hypothetical protein
MLILFLLERVIPHPKDQGEGCGTGEGFNIDSIPIGLIVIKNIPI